MTAASIELGHGHSLQYTTWVPDRDLNPQYRRLPDVPRWGAIVRHPLHADDPNPECRRLGYCQGSITFDGPVQAQIQPDRPRWQVLSAEPLTLSPSLKCHCGDHGHIQAGQWVP